MRRFHWAINVLRWYLQTLKKSRFDCSRKAFHLRSRKRYNSTNLRLTTHLPCSKMTDPLWEQMPMSVEKTPRKKVKKPGKCAFTSGWTHEIKNFNSKSLLGNEMLYNSRVHVLFITNFWSATIYWKPSVTTSISSSSTRMTTNLFSNPALV